MRIALYTTRFQPAWDWGGPVRSSWNLARGLAKLGAEVTVVTTNARQRGVVDVPRQRVEQGVRIVAAPVLAEGRWALANRFAFCPGLGPALARAVRGADLVHVEGLWSAGHPLVFGLCRGMGVPYVFCPRGNLESYSLGQKRGKKAAYLRLVARPNLLAARAVLYTTRQELQTAPGWLRGVTPVIVPNPVEVPHDGVGSRFRERLGVQPGELLLGMVGRVNEKKGFSVLLPAMGAARLARPVRLAVIGPDEADYGRTVRGLIQQHGLQEQVTLVGRLSGQDLADAYAGLDALLVPSFEENFGNVVVEALAQGTPPVISEEVGLRHWVEENRAGLVLPLEQARWQQLLEGDELERLLEGWDAEGNRRRAREEFSIDNVAGKVMAEYEGLLN